jgi:hypothetical protein
MGLRGVRLGTEPALVIGEFQATPSWRALFFGQGHSRWIIHRVNVNDAQLPQRGIAALLQAQDRRRAAMPPAPREPKAETSPSAADAPLSSLSALVWLPERIVLERITWQSTAGESLALSANAELSEARDAVQLDLRLAGGRVSGPVRWMPQGARGISLRGELVTQGLRLDDLPAVRARLSGTLQATTQLDAQVAQLAALPSALQTRTQFTVSGAVLKGVDLAKAVRTLGLSRGGQTALDTLSGQVSTRATGPAMTLALSNLDARSGVLRARGQVQVGQASREGARGLSGRMDVDLSPGDGAVGQAVSQFAGIPLEISGTTLAPEVRPTTGALIGGTIGSILAPGAGTAAGAKMGDRAMQTLGNWKDRLLGK